VWSFIIHGLGRRDARETRESGGSLLVGCKGSPSFLKLGYSYKTTSHLNAVQVPKQLLVDKEAGETFRVTLRKRNGAVEIARLE
jgi:hypothetical protein